MRHRRVWTLEDSVPRADRAKTIGKQHFTTLYDKARKTAFTLRNIRASWSKAGLFPFNPNRVLSSMQRLTVEQSSTAEITIDPVLLGPSHLLRTPTTIVNFDEVRSKLESKIEVHNDQSRLYLQKLANAAEKLFTDCALLFGENKLLFEQNNEKVVRQSTRSTVVGLTEIMLYDDIVKAERKRMEKEIVKASRSSAAQVSLVPTARTLSFADKPWKESEKLRR